MAVELVPAEREHAHELGRICFEAFRGIHDKHAFPRDFPTLEIAQQVVGMLIERNDFYGVAALLDGKPVGSNFLSLMDPVAGVGPITVDPACQGKGIGRALMSDVVNYARRHDIPDVRLQQDSFNVASLSLYASLGFEVKQACAVMRPAPAPEPDPSVRVVEEHDLPAIEDLSTRIYKASRRNEVARAAPYGFLALLRERAGRITGYLVAGLFGHGVAESEEDALALIGEVGRRLPPEAAPFFCTLGQASLYRKLLANGCRMVKVMNYMTIGPGALPDGVWLPSVLY